MEVYAGRSRQELKRRKRQRKREESSALSRYWDGLKEEEKRKEKKVEKWKNLKANTEKWHHMYCMLNFVVPVCEVSKKAGGWRGGSEDEREEVGRDVGGVKVEKAWATKLSAEEEPLWKLWGLRGAEMGKQNTGKDANEEKRK